MAMPGYQLLRIPHDLPVTVSRSICTSGLLMKNVRTGVPKITKNRSRSLTYEQSQKPSLIGVTKAWTSWNTSGLYMEDESLVKWLPRSSETATEDAYIRKFIHGTFHKKDLSEPIIKRRGNVIFISFYIREQITPHRIYFLKSYSEELLPRILKCPVKLEIQTVKKDKDLIFKYI